MSGQYLQCHGLCLSSDFLQWLSPFQDVLVALECNEGLGLGFKVAGGESVCANGHGWGRQVSSAD